MPNCFSALSFRRRLCPLVIGSLFGLTGLSGSVNATPLLIQASEQQQFEQAYQAFQQAKADESTPKLRLQQLAFTAYMSGRDHFGAEHINTANLALNHLFLLEPKQRISQQSHALAALVVRVYQGEYGPQAIELLDPLLLALETMPAPNEKQISNYEMQFAQVFSAHRTKNPQFVVAIKIAMAEQLMRLNQRRPELWTSLYNESEELYGADHATTVKTAFYAAMENAGAEDFAAAVNKLEYVVAVDARDNAATLQLQLAAYYRLINFYQRLNQTAKVDVALRRVGEMNHQLSGQMVEEALYRVSPEFPAEEATAGRSGTVQLIYDIGTDGRTKNIRVDSATNDAFAAAARESVSAWLYVPAYDDNGEVTERKNVEVQLDFNLQGN
ncbi:hypothetical protein PSI9734_00877 [Pseudidiomarina piscicola]|uniref:TonB C-terminal domain-containing protein n=1 Tax=Pseudidiomarina piscicola TaxID=2614830 RepID=A0A6S6WTX9_9GAMM|nr:TonB family protein [Pseudidiomarina piscicola]CAB0150326.1 hypothetical protein PSI9734_00877 [Pseudidiomarina piscicola]VZT39754.1 hypothetical protein PSI9734_00877 [Pseudomonas aeruginosa]